MSGSLLPLGLLLSGAAGFLVGSRPSLLSLRTGGDPQARARAISDLLYPLAVAFFAGFVFSTLVPHVLFDAHAQRSIPAFLAGMAGMGLFSRLVIRRDPCCEGGHDHRGFGALSLAAMSVCSLNDGILLGLIEPAWFSGLNLGMILHKVTSSFAVAQVLRTSRFRGAGLAGFGVAYVLISPAALIAARGFGIKDLPGGDLVLGFSAGMLVYVTLASMIPHALGILRRRPRAAYGFFAALAVSVSLGLWHGSLHGDDPEEAGRPDPGAAAFPETSGPPPAGP
jgi:zinc transporter ZupT